MKDYELSVGGAVRRMRYLRAARYMESD